jgi:hypothetical protein
MACHLTIMAPAPTVSIQFGEGQGAFFDETEEQTDQLTT